MYNILNYLKKKKKKKKKKKNFFNDKKANFKKFTHWRYSRIIW